MKSPRKAKPEKTKPGERTNFQLHKSQQTIFSGIIDDVFDFTEYKLTKYIDGISEPEELEKMNIVLKDYLLGNVAVAWNKGIPVWIQIVKG